ncbi:MAG TPA: glycosyltransferase family 87 protein [Vicinamibacterales bacterium]|nr:glycosyltransferase family 87 protein [Vicinamibacterales bacterium]
MSTSSSPPPPSTSTSQRLGVWGTALLLLSWFIYIHTMATPGLVDRAGRFKGTDHIYFYVMGSLMLDGRTEDLYSPEAHIAEGRRRIDPTLRLYQPHSNYGPQVALAFAPLARLSYASSLTLFLLFTAICYGLSVWIIWRDLPGLAPYGRLVALLAAASPLLFALLRYAQLSAITLLLLALALAALRRNRRFLAGIVLGTLIFKPQLGLVLGIALVMAAEWQVVAGAAAAGLTQITLAWTVSSTSVMRHYVDVLWRLLRDPALVQIYPTELHSLRGFLQLLLPHSPFVNFISLVSTAALLAIAIRVWKGGSDIGVRWGTLVLLTILASPHLLTYDLLLLSIPVLTFADWAVTHRDDRRHAAVKVCLLFLYLAPFSANLARLWPVQTSVIAIGALTYLGISLGRKAAVSGDAQPQSAVSPQAA